jgi:hypothetical protein
MSEDHLEKAEAERDRLAEAIQDYLDLRVGRDALAAALASLTKPDEWGGNVDAENAALSKPDGEA